MIRREREIERERGEADLQELYDHLELVEDIEAIRGRGEENEPLTVLKNSDFSSIISSLTKQT
jgi:hypothetical protein